MSRWYTRAWLPSWATLNHGAVECTECKADAGYGPGSEYDINEAIKRLQHNWNCSLEPRKEWRRG